MQVKIKKLSDKATIPSKRVEDAGFDLTATSHNSYQDDKGTFGYIEYGTDLAIEIPPGYVGLIYPRGSISKTGLILANSVGVIDSGYRGELMCRFKWIARTAVYKIGDRVAQLVIVPIPDIELEEVSELSNSERGEGAFGSTGK